MLPYVFVTMDMLVIHSQDAQGQQLQVLGLKSLIHTGRYMWYKC